jgi:putative thioredoxin
MTYEIQDFQKDVIEASYQTPVFVDFWAEWCGPCKMVGPILEKLAEESEGKWKLAKVDTEQHQDLAAQWNIRSIPNMKLFAEGKVVAELTGALPEYQLKKWLGAHIPSQAGKRITEAEQIAAAGKTDEAIITLEKALTLEKDNEQGLLLLGRLIVFEQPERAKELAAPLRHRIEAEHIIIIAEALADIELPEGPPQEKLLQAVENIRQKDFEAALNLLIDSIVVNKAYADELARRLVLAIFYWLGSDHELTRKYRRKFDMSLY